MQNRCVSITAQSINISNGQLFKLVRVLSVTFLLLSSFLLLLGLGTNNVAASGSWIKVASLKNADKGYAETYEDSMYMIGEYLQIYNRTDGFWTVKGNADIDSRGGSAIVGDRIYIVYNWGDAVYYDITAGEFVNIAHSYYRLDVAVGELNGIIYVSGGWLSGNSTPITLVQAYNPANNTWWTVAPMLYARSNHEMVGLNGYLYAIGGQNSAAVEKYDPNTNSWSKVAKMNVGRREFGATTHMGTIVVNGWGADPISTEEYIPELDKWFKGPDLITGTTSYMEATMASLDGAVFSIGGRDAPDHEYDMVFRWDGHLEIGDPPTEPLNLTANAGDERVDLAWSPPLNDSGFPVRGYSLFRGDGPTNLSLYLTLENITKYTDTNVKINNNYYYAVSALNLNGLGAKSNIVNATPYGIRPDPPRGLVADGYDGHVNLTWRAPSNNGSSDVVGYIIYRGTDETNLPVLDIVTELNYTDDMVINGVTYYYTVTAKNQDGEGKRSNMVSAVPGGPPDIPTNLKIINGNGTLILTWVPPSDDGGFQILGYRIFRGSNASALTILTSTSNMTTFTDALVELGEVHYYSLKAYNKKGDGPMSGMVNGTPFGVPRPPVGLKAIPGYLTIQIKWKAPESDKGRPVKWYWVYRGTSTKDLKFFSNVSAVEFNDTNVSIGIRYYYAIAALNLQGSSVLSETVSAMSLSAPDTTKPQLIISNPANNSILKDGNINVTGTSSDDVEVSKVEISTDGKQWVLVNGTLNWTGHLVLGFGKHTIYVKATDNSENEQIKTVTITVKQPPPKYETTTDFFNGPVFFILLFFLIIGLISAVGIYNYIFKKKNLTK